MPLMKNLKCQRLIAKLGTVDNGVGLDYAPLKKSVLPLSPKDSHFTAQWTTEPFQFLALPILEDYAQFSWFLNLP